MIWISHRPGRESNRRIRAILQQELIQGRKLASQLQTMLRSSSSNSSSSPESPSTTTSVVVVEDLAEQIMATFNESLSMLDFAQISDFDDDDDDHHHHGSEIIPAAHVNLHDDDDDQVGSAVTSYWDHGTAGKSHQDSSISECSKTSVAPPKDRRGCYKRRRKTSLTSEKVTPNFLDDDGHAWRKYGQKQILNAKHPRNYYRCTHKYEQGCKATKQVQRIDDQDAPPMYKTTYHDHHTCRNPPLILNPPPADHHHQIILDSSSTRDSSSSSTLILNFESKVILGKKPEDDSYTMIKHDIFDHDEHYCNAKEEEEAAEELDNSQSCTMYQYPDHDSSVQLTAAPSGSSDYLITTSGLQQIMNAAEPLPMHANMIPAEQEESISGVLYSYTPSCTTLDHPRSIGILDHDMTVGIPNFDDINEFEF